jgi:hypothetical protein
MDLTKHKQVQQKCEEKAHYFNNIAFTELGSSFAEASDTLKELIEILDKLNELTIEDEKVETEITTEEGGNG